RSDGEPDRLSTLHTILFSIKPPNRPGHYGDHVPVRSDAIQSHLFLQPVIVGSNGNAWNIQFDRARSYRIRIPNRVQADLLPFMGTLFVYRACWKHDSPGTDSSWSITVTSLCDTTILLLHRHKGRTREQCCYSHFLIGYIYRIHVDSPSNRIRLAELGSQIG